MARLHPSMAQLLALVDEAFDHPAWHGPTLRGSLRGVTAAQAAWRPAPGRHSIREIALHTAYWKHAVTKRLIRETRWLFPIEGANWFDAARSRSWNDDVRLLVEEHRMLRNTIAAYSARALRTPVDKRGQTAEFTIRGIAAHDVYHAGQIQLLKKLQGRKAGGR
jgi:DinB superfamily